MAVGIVVIVVAAVVAVVVVRVRFGEGGWQGSRRTREGGEVMGGLRDLFGAWRRGGSGGLCT